jgi:hypothetical protein
LESGIGILLVLMLLLQFKHMLADYFLQTKIMLDGRDQYIHLGRFLHVGVHVIGSILSFLLVGAPVVVILPLVLAEWIAHYHIDWWKGHVTKSQNLTPADPAYWRASGLDQALHQLTYIAMIWGWFLMLGS